MKCGNCGRECTPGQASICSECGLVLCPDCRSGSGALCPHCFSRLDRLS